jgi:methylenetetrahydrofolate dehydrogenase (NADP+)/methenyltetrahydrofolate cyclohydrolase
MESKLIDGKAIAKAVGLEVAEEVQAIFEQDGVKPKLAVIVVGEDPASQTYVKSKEKACAQAGMESESYRLPESTTEEELLTLIAQLNEDPSVNGILVQLPLPRHISVDPVIQMIDPDKDVDGFHVRNIGNMAKGGCREYLPCTPNGVLELLKRYQIEIEGKHCVVIGRSNLVGKPVSLMLQEANGTVTMCHSRTKDLAAFCRMADILVVAAGKPHLVDGSMIKEGAVVIDVGIHRTENGLCGDVNTESCMGIASAITPVPGGVGPMTVAMLMKNCLLAYKKVH